MPGGETASLSRGLVGYWRFDDGYGSLTARDLSGNGNDCQLRRLDPSAAWTHGRLGGAVSLHGHGLAGVPAGSRRWPACRARSPSRCGSAAAAPPPTCARWSAASSAPGSRTPSTSASRDDQLWMRSRIKGGPTHAFAPRPRGLWFHAAATVDAAGTARIYINGEEVKRNLKEGRPSLGGGTNPLIIGGGINRPDADFVREVFQGALDELLIYDRALSPEEMVSLANGQQPRLSLVAPGRRRPSTGPAAGPCPSRRTRSSSGRPWPGRWTAAGWCGGCRCTSAGGRSAACRPWAAGTCPRPSGTGRG